MLIDSDPRADASVDPDDQGNISTQPSSDARYCREVARQHGRSFYLASLCLSPGQRKAIHAIYAYCRVADDIVDQMALQSRGDAERQLNDWQNQLDCPNHPVSRAFARARSAYAIPVDPAVDLLQGLRMDLAPRHYATWPELREYCHAVAGTVGLLSAPVLGCNDPGALDRAAELGIAMQLTNILRDVAEDARSDRLYLPLSDLQAFDCDPESVLRGQPSGRFPELIAFEIDRARHLYASALLGVPSLDRNGRLATLAAARFYGEILTEIELADFDVFRGRARVSTARKLRQTPRVAAAFIRTALPQSMSYGRN